MSVRILVGDVREQIRTLPDDSVHCVVTSPPYWRQRDGQLQKAVAIDLDLSPKTVSDVHTGKTWRGA